MVNDKLLKNKRGLNPERNNEGYKAKLYRLITTTSNPQSFSADQFMMEKETITIFVIHSNGQVN